MADRREAVENIQGDAYLWGIGELGPRVALVSIAGHLGIDQQCIEDALRFLPPYKDEATAE